MQLVLQPCSDADAIEHYVDTIQNRVPLDRILPHLSATQQEGLREAFGTEVAIWGVTPGQDGGNANKWRRIEIGDTALLYRNRRFFFKGIVAHKVHSPSLARELWQERKDGHTWEYVFFLTDLEPVDIAVTEFNRLAGYKDANIIQGFNVLPANKSERIIEGLSLSDRIGAILPGATDVQRAKNLLDSITGSLDIRGDARRRAEQRYLRDILLSGRRAHACSLCSRILPVDLLVIGHIRKRHSCTIEQKKDLANVMPVCVLGCDSLFENGYIHVDGVGTIRVNPAVRAFPELATAALRLEGASCAAWSERSSTYFQWHRDHPRRFQ